MNAPNPTLADELNAAIAWWRMAGVDQDFAADATDWLGDEAPASDAQTAPEASSQLKEPNLAAKREVEPAPQNIVERTDFLGESPPATLEEFRAFWLDAPGLDAIGPRGRVAPRGIANPELMVLVTDPEEADRETLLSGPQGRLLSNMLRAMGIGEDAVYIAAALPRHTPLADLPTLAAGGLDDVTLHHIGLVSPQKLVVFGRGLLPLLKLDVSNSDTYLREINQNSRKIQVMTSEGFDSLLTMPQLKAKFWRRWTEWAAELR